MKAWLLPLIIATVLAVGEEAKAAKSEAGAALDVNAITAYIKIVELTDKGVLAAAAPAREFVDPKTRKKSHRPGKWQDELVFVYGADPFNFEGRYEFALKLYPVGTYRYESVLGEKITIRSYAVSPELAARLRK